MSGYLEVLGAVSIWAFFNGVLVKGIKTSGIGVGMWTGLIGVGIFTLNFDYSSLRSLDNNQLIGLMALGLFSALNNSCFYTALKISVPTAAIFHYLAPILVVLWSFLLPIFYKPISNSEILALILGFIGIGLVVFPKFKERNSKLIYLGLGSAIFYSLEIILSGYISKELNVNPRISSLFKLIFQSAVMFSLSILLRESLKIKGGKEWLKISLAGLLLYSSFILYFSGSATVPPIHLGFLSYIDRIGVIVLGALVFKEKISKNAALGAALILGSSLLLLL